MAPLRLLPALLASLLLAGCFGYPPGSAKPGDTVTLVYTATDSASGETILQGESLTFTLAPGESGFTQALAGAALGKRPGDAFALTYRGGAGPLFPETVLLDQELARLPIEHRFNTTEFTRRLGTPFVGLGFQASQDYNATVVAVGERDVVFHLDARDGQRVEVPAYGLAVVDGTDGANRTKALQPLVGARFAITPETQVDLFPRPGSYEARPARDGKVEFGYSAAPLPLLGKDVRLEATLVAVSPGPASPPPGGAYGLRVSPQLGDQEPAAASSAAVLAADGHAHTH